MRICLLANGKSIHTVRWANALARRGHEIQLVTLHGLSKSLSREVGTLELRFPPPVGYFMNIPSLRRHLRRVRPDLVHTHYASGYGTLGRLSGFHPQVLSVWGADVFDVPEVSPQRRRMVVANISHADWVCSTSHVMAERTRQLYPPVQNLTVTPFGVDTDQFAPRPRSRDHSVITIGTVKTLAHKYGIDTLIEGFAHCRRLLHQRDLKLAERLRLRVVGGGPQRDELEKLAKQTGVAQVTRFIGPVDHGEVPDQLNQLDIYVAASRMDSESFGVAAVEASACGLPVVVSDAGGLPEVVVDGKTGLVVPHSDPAALAQALVRLTLDRQLRHALGVAGRQHVMHHYQWDENVSRMEKVYEQIVGSRHIAA